MAIQSFLNASIHGFRALFPSLSRCFSSPSPYLSPSPHQLPSAPHLTRPLTAQPRPFSPSIRQDPRSFQSPLLHPPLLSSPLRISPLPCNLQLPTITLKPQLRSNPPHFGTCQSTASMPPFTARSLAVMKCYGRSQVQGRRKED